MAPIPNNPEITLLLLIMPFLFIGSWAPASPYRQYYYPFVPFLLLGNIYGLARERTLWAGWVIVAVVAESFIQSVLALPPGGFTRHPSNWPIFAAHETGLDLERLVPHGRILTLTPILPLEGGLEIYPAFATGPFAWRIARFVDAQRRARCGFVAPADLAAFLEKQPPAAILTGGENSQLEERIKRYAWTHHYRPHSLWEPDYLWLPTEAGSFSPPQK